MFVARICLRFQRREGERRKAEQTQVKPPPLLHAARISKFTLLAPYSAETAVWPVSFLKTQTKRAAKPCAPARLCLSASNEFWTHTYNCMSQQIRANGFGKHEGQRHWHSFSLRSVRTSCLRLKLSSFSFGAILILRRQLNFFSKEVGIGLNYAKSGNDRTFRCWMRRCAALMSATHACASPPTLMVRGFWDTNA